MGLGEPFPPDIEDPEQFFTCMALSMVMLVYFVAHQAWMMRLEGETPTSGKKEPNFSVTVRPPPQQCGKHIHITFLVES